MPRPSSHPAYVARSRRYAAVVCSESPRSTEMWRRYASTARSILTSRF